MISFSKSLVLMAAVGSGLGFISASVMHAQDTPVPSLRRPGARQQITGGSPEVGADGRVTFRFRSAKAGQVVARGQFGAEVVLTKDGEDNWSGTTSGAVGAGVYEYSMVVDGTSLPDPLNRALKPQRWPGSSILHIPADPPAPWDPQEVPATAVHRHTGWSAELETWRSVVVITPPGLRAGAAADAPLPVLYLSHGFSDTEETWTVHGKADQILASQVAAGRARPMLIVMPDAHALPPPRGWSDGYAAENTDAFARELIDEVIPFIEKNYPVRTGAAHRAFAGLSMGGRHALTLALRHSDVFSHIGAFSAAPPDGPTMEAGLPQAARLNDGLNLFWIACGKKDFLFERNEEVHAALTKAGVKHDYVVTEGDHSWPVWRRYLVDFLPLLFR